MMCCRKSCISLVRWRDGLVSALVSIYHGIGICVGTYLSRDWYSICRRPKLFWHLGTEKCSYRFICVGVESDVKLIHILPSDRVLYLQISCGNTFDMNGLLEMETTCHLLLWAQMCALTMLKVCIFQNILVAFEFGVSPIYNQYEVCVTHNAFSSASELLLLLLLPLLLLLYY